MLSRYEADVCLGQTKEGSSLRIKLYNQKGFCYDKFMLSNERRKELESAWRDLRDAHLHWEGAVENKQRYEECLERLATLMTEAQQLRFKYAVVQQAVANIERRLPPEDDDDGERGALNEARRWLADPTPEIAKDILIHIVFEYMDGGLRYSDYSRDFIRPAEAVAFSSVTDAARDTLALIPEAEQTAARQWQVEAAAAILSSTS